MADASVDMAALGELIDYPTLEAHAAEFRSKYDEALPWRHLVIDNILRTDVALRAATAFPPLDKLESILARLFEARVYGGRIDHQDAIFTTIFSELHGTRFTTWVENVTGIDGLVGDSLLIGAGFHQGGRGSRLPLHADHNTHPQDSTRYRRVNVLIYLNQTWQAGWGGDLELWDRQANSCQKRIEPTFNRCVILEVDDTSFHGYAALRIPRNRTRNTLAAYYYADAPAPGQAAEPHPTLLPGLRKKSWISYVSYRARRALLWRIAKIIMPLAQGRRGIPPR
jgi:hypothetical protein